MVDLSGSCRCDEKQLNLEYTFKFILKYFLHCRYCFKYFHAIAHLILQQPYDVGTINIPILQMS